MSALLTALVSGLLFGLDLTVSGMIDPARVLGFLDIAGAWNPSLAFTMAGAIAGAAAAFAIGGYRDRPWFAPWFRLPEAVGVDRKLLFGSALFGAGWGLVGYCPGPALAALALGNRATAIFVSAMLAGMALVETARRLPRRAAAPSTRQVA